MKILVSACLVGDNCKYNGGNNLNERLVEFLAAHEVVKVCPEVLGGLTTPRAPAEIQKGQVVNTEGRNVTKEFEAGALRAFEIVEKEKPDLIILQSRSPSCGIKQIYDGSFSGTLIEGRGVFAQLLVDNGIKVLDLEDV